MNIGSSGLFLPYHKACRSRAGSKLFVDSIRSLVLEPGLAYAVSKALSFVRRGGREAEGGGLLNRYRGLNPYRGFESPSLRQISPETAVIVRRALCLDILGRRVERDRINVAMLKGRIDESAPPTLPRA